MTSVITLSSKNLGELYMTAKARMGRMYMRAVHRWETWAYYTKQERKQSDIIPRKKEKKIRFLTNIFFLKYFFIVHYLEERVADGGVPLHGDGQGQVDAPREAHLGHRQHHSELEVTNRSELKK